MNSGEMTILEAAQFSAPPTLADNGNHPILDDAWWQESAVFMWGDVERQFGGEIRFGIQPNQGVANLYTWTMLAGEMIDRRFLTDLPLPTSNILDCSISGASVRTLEPLMRYELALDQDDLSLRMTWRNFHHPVSMSFNVGGATLANGHYDAMGEMKGVGRYKGHEFEIDAVGFADHSWGVRRKHLPASRCLFAVFDENFYITAIPISTGPSRAMVGYVYKDGLVGRLSSHCEMGYRFRDDWITPAGCDTHLFDEHDRHFMVKGWTIGPSSTQTLGHGKLVTHAVAGFECDGRKGSGILESSQFHGLPPSITSLGFKPDSWWINP